MKRKATQPTPPAAVQPRSVPDPLDVRVAVKHLQGRFES